MLRFRPHLAVGRNPHLGRPASEGTTRTASRLRRRRRTPPAAASGLLERTGDRARLRATGQHGVGHDLGAAGGGPPALKNRRRMRPVTTTSAPAGARRPAGAGRATPPARTRPAAVGRSGGDLEGHQAVAGREGPVGGALDRRPCRITTFMTSPHASDGWDVRGKCPASPAAARRPPRRSPSSAPYARGCDSEAAQLRRGARRGGRRRRSRGRPRRSRRTARAPG